MGRAGSLAATIAVIIGAAAAAGTFQTWMGLNEACTGSCAPQYQVQIRLCLEDATGSGCGSINDHVQLTPCCANAVAAWSAWSAPTACNANMTCGAEGPAQTRTCGALNGCPVNTTTCVGDTRINNGNPCATARTDGSYQICLFPKEECFLPYFKTFMNATKRYGCVVA
ncbi:unnamed protein product, partial [Mesorhabditis spiculigera]